MSANSNFQKTYKKKTINISIIKVRSFNGKIIKKKFILFLFNFYT